MERQTVCKVLGRVHRTLGYGIGANNGILAHAPQMLSLVFGGSGIVPAALVAILLNLAIPKDENG